MKRTHALVCYDYIGASVIPRVHAFGFIQTEDDGSEFGNFDLAIALAEQHWRHHFTYHKLNGVYYPDQVVTSYAPAVLIEHLFNWGVPMVLLDPSLPRIATCTTRKAP